MKAFKHLLHDKFDIVEGDALVVASYDEFKQIVTQHFENHANVGAIHTADFKVVQ